MGNCIKKTRQGAGRGGVNEVTKTLSVGTSAEYRGKCVVSLDKSLEGKKGGRGKKPNKPNSTPENKGKK